MIRLLTILFAFSTYLSLPALAQQSATDDAAYVGSQVCAGCHDGINAKWSGSHHALAWTAPSEETIVADFNNTSLLHDGVLTDFSRDGDSYKIDVTEADGTKKAFVVHSVAGIEPLQQYIIETEPGQLQSFDIVWDTVEKRWFHLYPDQKLPPEDGLHWTGPYKNWNGRCAECHATGFEKNFDAAAQTYASTQAEIGVGCEACHGPGSRHVSWADGNASTPSAPPTGYGFSMDFANAGTEATIQQCAGCHARREPLSDGNPVPGTAFGDAYTLALLRPGLYHADGQIQDEVYVYGSFLQSKMYAKGVGCLNCHDAHTANLKAEGNALCSQCHSPAGNPDFPSLPLKVYDDPSHHFHDPESEGAQCTNCHMVERVYMGVDGRRDHSFRIPRPDLADQTGSPSACADCHGDQDPSWASAEIAKRHPEAANREPHYGAILAQGRADPVGAQIDLAGLAQSADHAGLVRATALWLLSQGADEEMTERVAPLLEDQDPLVRAAAIGVQARANPQAKVQRIVGLLEDPVRMVRIAAAKSMLNAPIARLPARIAEQMRSAMGEWQLSLASRIDFPETHMVLGGMALTMRNIPAAEGAFREVVRLDPQHVEAWVMLTRIAAAMDGEDATRAVLAEALKSVPGNETLLSLRRSIPDD
ncbi:MAG: HEAT repeat domain-containing protein [Rhodobacteraceae bacterium]|nr:HEAT repeat domain-containing protein [Paracoccaceae bacterium]